MYSVYENVSSSVVYYIDLEPLAAVDIPLL